jgi:O-antigen/teichoic acid export membrane protein
MSIINPVFTRVALPLFSRIQDDNARLIRGYLQTVRTIALISFPVYLFLIIASDSIVHILLGPKWSNAAPIVSLLSGLGFVFTLSNPIGSLVLAKGRPGLAMLFTVAAVIVYGVSIYLGAFLGLTGAAIGFLFGAWGILFPAEFWLRWKLVGMRPFDYMTAIGRIGVVTLLCLLSAKGLVYFMTRNTKLAGVDLAIGIVAVTAYFTALWFSERELLQQTYRLIRQR